jgi:tetratricopeptide (TPR) repeat protein
VETLTDRRGIGAADAIDGYHITGLLGEGGMGVVYAAEQLRPVRRRVAVKVIRAGMHSSVVARFAAERQALAVMEHPNIAKVFDAGITAIGNPYIAMEYVEGVPLTRYCDERRLSARARLLVFVPICGAIQHAHQKGVIHRDLKPSNVLVEELPGGEPLPKVIDFGIAKAVGQRLTDATLATEYGQVMGTPAYMSPEQAEGAGVDVDTRSDVYALGVLLYELLAGSLPADPTKMGLVPFITRLMAGLIEACPPSARVTEAGAAAAEVAALRGADPASLARDLRGDLDAIVLKAMAPERDRRYQTALELAQDIERHLRHEPIAARAPSPGYRAGKFVRRHPVGVALAASAVLFLAGLTTVTSVQARRVARARAVAEQRRTQAEELLSYMVGELRTKLEPIGRLELLDDVGTRALAYFAAVPASELSDAELFRRSQSLGQLGQLRMAQGDLAEAMPALRESLAQMEDLAARDTADSEWQVGLGASRFWVGYTHYLQGALDSALVHFEPYLAISRRLVERDSTNAAWQLELGYAHSNIGSVREAQGDLRAALDAFRYTLGVKQRLVARDPANVDWRLDLAITHNTVGRVLERLGRLDSAQAHYDADLTIKREIAARDTANTLWQQALMPAFGYAAGIAELRGDLATARTLTDSTRRVALLLVARDSANANWLREDGVTAYRLGRLDVALGRRAAGVAALRHGRGTLARLVARDTTNADLRLQLAIAEIELGTALLTTGDAGAVAQLARSAAAHLAPLAAKAGAERRLGMELARARLLEAEVHDGQQEPERAHMARVAALAAIGTAQAADELRAIELRARTLAALGRRSEAAPLVDQLRRAGYREPGFMRFATRVAADGARW